VEKTGAAMTGIRLIRKTCLLLAPVFFFICFLPCAGARADKDEVGQIAGALRNQQFERALELLHPALQASPENSQLWTMQGTAYVGMGNTKEALASFRNALKIAPNDVSALQGEAQIEYEANSVAAIPVLQHLLRLRPDDRTSHGMLAVIEYGRGDCASAVIHFEKSGSLFDSKVDALHANAICLVKLKQFDKAAKAFERAVALEPDDKRERQLLASIQLMAHEPQSAIASLAPLLGSDNPDVGTLELAAAAYEDAHDTGKAVDTLRQAILLDPGNVNLYLDFANVSSVHQSFQVGIDVVNDGIGQQPDAAPLYFARGVLYVQLGKYDQAQSDFERAYDLDPNQSLSVAAQGLADVNANDLDRALTTVQTNLKRKPNDPILLYLQADVLSRKGVETGTPEFQLAMRSARKAVSVRPGLGPARSVLAKLYLQAGQYPEAIEQCKKALDIDPKDQTSLYRLIQALRKTGKNNELPPLLKRLALLRQEATKEERQNYRYKLIEGSSPPAQSAQP
jgi:tetratricopeptide (TPR) repeat protein